LTFLLSIIVNFCFFFYLLLFSFSLHIFIFASSPSPRTDKNIALTTQNMTVDDITKGIPPCSSWHEAPKKFFLTISPKSCKGDVSEIRQIPFVRDVFPAAAFDLF